MAPAGRRLRACRLSDAVRAEQRLSAWSRTSSPSAGSADFGENVPICAILRHALSERCPHRGTKCHTGVSRHPVDSGGIGRAARFDARGLDLSAGECLSRGQSSTDVLPGSMASTNNRKAPCAAYAGPGAPALDSDGRFSRPPGRSRTAHPARHAAVRLVVVRVDGPQGGPSQLSRPRVVAGVASHPSPVVREELEVPAPAQLPA